MTFRPDGVEVAIPAPGAARLFFCTFEGAHETARIALPHRQGDVFHGFLPGIAAGTAYGLRADGPGFDQ